MDQGDPQFIKQLRNGAAQPDGSAVAFEIETRGGEVHALACTVPEVEHIVTWLVGLGLLAHQQSKPDGPAQPAASINATPIDVQRIATGKGQAPGQCVVGFDVGPFTLAFALPEQGARILRDSLSRMLGG